MNRSDSDRLYRASNFCHYQSHNALQRGDLDAWCTWRDYAVAYSSAARLLSRNKWRRSATDGGMEPCKRNAEGACWSWRTILEEQ